MVVGASRPRSGFYDAKSVVVAVVMYVWTRLDFAFFGALLGKGGTAPYIPIFLESAHRGPLIQNL